MGNAKTGKKIAIITGASAGLGREFALQIEKSFFLDEIWLLARRVGPMNELVEKFQKSVGVPIAVDLTDPGDIAAFHKRLENEAPEVCVLVNNAGYGKIGPFHELGTSEQLQMIDLNVRALTHMTKICLPFMKPGAKILQVASSAAYAPAPNFSVYAATKAYVVNFSEALNYELRNLGIQVTAVCPGPVATEFFAVAQNNEFMKDKVGEAEPFNKFLMANAADVVEKALRDAGRGKTRSIYGLPVRLLVAAAPVFPSSITMRFLDRAKRR